MTCIFRSVSLYQLLQASHQIIFFRSFSIFFRASSFSFFFIVISRMFTDGENALPSPQSITDPISPEMKDLSSVSNRHARNSQMYPRKRPSPHGISKSHKSPVLSQNAIRKTPRSAKTTLLQQRQLQYRRDGIILEDEYREDIRCYMHEMEVRSRSYLFYPVSSSRSCSELHNVFYSIDGPTA